MKKLFRLIVSSYFSLVKLPVLEALKVSTYFQRRKLRYLFSTLGFISRNSPFIEHFGVDAMILGESTVIATQGQEFKLSIGDEVLISPNVEFRGRGTIKIGQNSSIGYGNIFSCTSSIIIGKDVITGDGVKYYTANHEYRDLTIPIRAQGEIQGTITLEDDVWIGANVVLLRNTHIEKGAIIGANSVVKGRIPKNEIWAGSPARKIKDR